MKPIAIGILLLIAIVLLAIAGSWMWRFYTAPIEGKVGAQEQIQSAGTRISAYNHFFDLYASIQSMDAAIEAQLEALKQTTSADDQNRIRANIAGLRAQKARSIAQYNADARKSYTIGQFRDWQLPYQIEK